MRIGLVSIGSADDARSWSGIPFHVKRSLVGLGHEVEDVSPLEVTGGRVRHRVSRGVARMGLGYRYEFDPAVVRSFGRQVTARLAAAPVDAVVATAAVVLSEARVAVPTALWTDATFANLRDTYPEFRSLPPWQVASGERVEHRVTAGTDVLAYASDWARQSAIGTFSGSEDRTVLAPFGASMTPPEGFDVDRAIAARSRANIRLGWIGSDWDRKRGAFAVEVVEALRDSGQDASLWMCGAGPTSDELPPFVQHFGFVDTSAPSGASHLSSLLGATHFLLLPSRAEAFGIVVAEAAGYGVPTVATAVGGLPSAVIDGVTGHLLAPDSNPTQHAAEILRTLGADGAYAAMTHAARADHEERLTWSASCRIVVRALTAVGDANRRIVPRLPADR